MSKSKWKEFPDWTEKTSYGFLKGAHPAVWAWEFLRRNPEYIADWQKLNDLQKKFGKAWATQTEAKIYTPPKKKNETDRKWLGRVCDAGIEPVVMRMDCHLAQKWGLMALYNPSGPYTQGVRFIKPGSEYPRQLYFPDDLSGLIEEQELDDATIDVFNSRIAIIAFDISKPVNGQGDVAEALLRQWKNKMIAAGKVKKAAGHAGKIYKWTRHLQVLDALRMSPPVTHEIIAKRLGGNKNKNEMPVKLRAEGGKFVTAARNAMKEYRKILLHSGKSSKNDPKPSGVRSS